MTMEEAKSRQDRRRHSSVFERFRPSRWQQACTVGDRRYEDALFLYRRGTPARWNSAVYLAGFAVELYLKGALLKAQPWLGTASLATLRSEGTEWKLNLYDLFWRSHDLTELLVASPKLLSAIELQSLLMHRAGCKATLWETFMRVASWNVAVRYTTFQVTRSEAEAFMSSIKEVLKWLREQIR
jgi:HEPN domain-containing protein